MPKHVRHEDPEEASANSADLVNLLPYESSIGFLLRDNARAIAKVLGDRIEPHGVSMGMWFLFRQLWVKDGLTQREISHKLGLMEPSVMEVLRSMERNGFVERVRSDRDRRKVHIHLTDEGRRLRKVLMPHAADVNDLISKCGSPGQLSMMKDMLIRLRKILSDDAVHHERASD